nr:polyprenyl synthetase family protein [Desulfobacterales bacterium]
MKKRISDFDLKAYLESKRKAVDRALEALWRAHPPTLLVKAMRYSLMAGGKRLRPILCIASAEAVGGSQDEVLPVACALELIHTYSLIHDDLPAMDNDDLRRGIPTSHKVFGEAIAILAGDALLTAAFEELASNALARNRDLRRWMEIIHIIARAAGFSGMVEGQMIDMASEGKLIPVEELESMHRLKSGALIEASIYSGALLGGANKAEAEALKEFGRHIGLAFQVTDDILDVEGDSKITGKRTGTDKKRQKATYPALLGLNEAKLKGRELVEKALQSLEIFDKKGDPLRAIAYYVIERKR